MTSGVCLCVRCLVELWERNAVFLSSASAKTSLQSIKSGMLVQHTNPCIHTHSHVACDLHEPSPEISIPLKQKHIHSERGSNGFAYITRHTRLCRPIQKDYTHLHPHSHTLFWPHLCLRHHTRQSSCRSLSSRDDAVSAMN